LPRVALRLGEKGGARSHRKTFQGFVTPPRWRQRARAAGCHRPESLVIRRMPETARSSALLVMRDVCLCLDVSCFRSCQAATGVLSLTRDGAAKPQTHSHERPDVHATKPLDWKGLALVARGLVSPSDIFPPRPPFPTLGVAPISHRRAAVSCGLTAVERSFTRSTSTVPASTRAMPATAGAVQR
jgi:hypothetical protein